jgi:serine-type D-Ala-D-Ala carboxypeptidase (penicillin-binding protein 5/6)
MIKERRICMSKINKILISCFLSLIFIFSLTLVPVEAAEKPATPTNGINVDAKSALLMEPVSGKIIFEKNSHEKLSPASVTKIMVMLIAMEAIDSGKINMNDKVTVSENAKEMGGSSMILDTGEVRTVEELLKGIAIASGNDAAVAMAEYLGGTEDAFVNLMNQRSKALGMNDTDFKNCTGLPAEGHVSSAFDIALMSRELLKHPKILKYTGTYMETISEGRKTPIGLVNHNKLVRFFKGCDGLKTGFTDDAKYCISSTAARNGVRMLAVIMGAPTFKVRNRDAGILMNYGFSMFQSKRILTKGIDIEKVSLNKQGDRYFIAKAGSDFDLMLEKGVDNKITKKCEIGKFKKEYKTGENVGYCNIYLDGKLCGKVTIYCDRDVKKASIFNNFKFNFMKILDDTI